MKGIARFIDGLKRDIAPVKNAISLPYNSGFVEGNKNKFKLIKRILYGRSGLANLFCKCYVAFSITQSKVSVQSLISGLNERTKKVYRKYYGSYPILSKNLFHAGRLSVQCDSSNNIFCGCRLRKALYLRFP